MSIDASPQQHIVVTAVTLVVCTFWRRCICRISGGLAGGIEASTHFAALLRIIAQFNGDVAEAERDIQRWNRGSVWIDLSPEQCSELGILLAEKRA